MTAINCNPMEDKPTANVFLMVHARKLMLQSGYADYCLPYPVIQQLLLDLKSEAHAIEGTYTKADISLAYSLAYQYILHRCFLFAIAKANLLFKQTEDGSLTPTPALQKALLTCFKEKGLTTTNEDFCYVVTRVENTKVNTVHVSTPTNDFKYLLTVFTEGTL